MFLQYKVLEIINFHHEANNLRKILKKKPAMLAIITNHAIMLAI